MSVQGHDYDGLPPGERDILVGLDAAIAAARGSPQQDDDGWGDDAPPPMPPEDADPGGEALPPCPVSPLGVGDDDRRYYVTPRGRLVALPPPGHQKLSLIGLFDGDCGWLVDAFPSFDKEGKPNGGWQALGAARWLMEQCAERGGFDPQRMMRGHGAWPPGRDDPASGLIVHCGDVVLVDGEPQRPGRIGRRIYPAKPPLPRPATRALQAEEGQRILAHIRDRWVWADRETMPRLALGYIAAGPLAAALETRPVIHVAGGRHTGKTTFLWFAGEILSDWAELLADTTAAAVRQLLSGSAKAVMVDELEGGEMYDRVREIVKIARLAWSDKSGRSARGTLGGKAETTRLDAMFLFSSIIRPPLPPADVDRFVMLEMVKEALPPERWETIRQDSEAIARLGPRLHRRMIDSWPRLRPLIAVLEEALTARGLTGRAPANLATLLACAEMATGSGELDPADIEAIVAPFDPLEMSERAGDEEGWHLCLDRLLTSPAPGWRGGEHRSIGRLVAEARDDPAGSSHRTLKDMGLRIWRRDDGDDFFAVAVGHTQLDQLFAETDWARGGWVADLKQAPGAVRTEPIRFVSNKRAVAVPLYLLDLEAASAPREF